ncbi:unnamed protein product [Cylindrotheca closterium]|uniref:Uncharacterized protein n=1 Tax=Cylindrotheca closterium TaxID=2856 RepID=A0AAD2PW46_9STRA|nr:unnamed protein product [Cylindrotheca closterium]
MEEDYPRDGIPQPPDIAKRTRCYKLNLNAEIHPISPSFVGPFDDVPPPLTFSTSDDSSVDVTTTQVAIRTAKIFRGITVGKDGTILSQNARATRSNRGSKNKKGEKSRQASKIEKAKDLVEESMLTGKAPDSDEPANMLSLVVMGEFDDMKHLVRDGAKKLRDATDLPEDTLLNTNSNREGMSLRSPRKRISPNHVGGHRGSTLQTPNKIRPVGLPQSAPPKAKVGIRDRPKYADDDNRFRGSSGYHDASGSSREVAPNHGEGDWSNTLSFSRGFHSIWNCGGVTGDDSGTTSIVQVSNRRESKAHSMGGAAAASPTNRGVFEGRDSNMGQVRESGIVSRAD